MPDDFIEQILGHSRDTIRGMIMESMPPIGVYDPVAFMNDYPGWWPPTIDPDDVEDVVVREPTGEEKETRPYHERFMTLKKKSNAEDLF